MIELLHLILSVSSVVLIGRYNVLVCLLVDLTM